MTEPLRIVTYNVHKCRGMDGLVRPSRNAEVLREIGAHIIALQEVLASQASYISELLEIPFVFGENRKVRGEPYGNALLTHLPITLTRNYDLSFQGHEERGCLRADIDLEAGRLLHIFNVHLGTALAERRYQARQLVASEMLNDVAIEWPRVVLGDFNEWTRGLATRLLSSQLVSADVKMHLPRSRTYPGLAPFLHLDHIYYDPALALDRLALHRTRRALVASDHLPLLGEFRWVQKENGSK